MLGRLRLLGRPASFASALIAAGVMSGVPTIFSCLRLLVTVERPLKPMTIAAMPNAIRTAAATTPPISNAFRMTLLPSHRLVGGQLRRCGHRRLRHPFAHRPLTRVHPFGDGANDVT